MMRIIGIILIVAGGIGLIFGGITYSRRRDTIQMGPINASVVQRETIPISPLLGGVAVIAGVVLLVAGSRRKT